MLFAAAAQDLELVRTWEAAQRERPTALSSQARIAPESEPGTPLVIRGRVSFTGGKRLAPGVTIFAHQTDTRGLYDAPGASGRRLTGGAKTDAEGRFVFRTVRRA